MTIKQKFTVGFNAVPVEREPTPYDKHLGEFVQLSSGGAKCLGILSSVEIYRGSEVLALSPYIQVDPSGATIINDRVEELVTNGSVVLVTPLKKNLEKYVEEINESNPRKRPSAQKTKNKD